MFTITLERLEHELVKLKQSYGPEYRGVVGSFYNAGRRCIIGALYDRLGGVPFFASASQPACSLISRCMMLNDYGSEPGTSCAPLRRCTLSPLTYHEIIDRVVPISKQAELLAQELSINANAEEPTCAR